MAAVTLGKEAGCEIALVDRDIQVTLRRAWKRMKFRQKFRLMMSLLGDEEDDETVDVNELLEDTDLLSSMMEELKTFSPGAGAVLIDERDAYIAEKLRALNPDKKILAVVGAGHLAGVTEHLQSSNRVHDLEELSTLPKRTAVATILPWAIPFGLMALVAILVGTGKDVDWIEFFTVWTIANAVFAAIGCIIARGHPLAILTAALASPITSLNPALAAGWFAGYVQLKVAEPTAEDLQRFLKLDDFSSFWSNPAGRVLLVTALTNLGSMAGAWVAAAGLLGGLGS